MLSQLNRSVIAIYSLLTTGGLWFIIISMRISRIIYLASLWAMGIALGVIVVSDILFPVSDAYLRTFGTIALIAAVGVLYGLISGRRRG